MQNLETKFPATSPNIQYLGQLQLLDQDQVLEENQGTGFNIMNESYEFQEYNATQQEEQRKADFKKFCQSALGFKLNHQSGLFQKILVGFALLFLREVLQYKFLYWQVVESGSSKKLNRLLGFSQKIYIIVKLFGIFAIFYLFPLQTTVLLIYLWKDHETQNYQSQANCITALSRQLNQSFLQLKITILQCLPKASHQKTSNNRLLSQLLTQIQQEFEIKVNSSEIQMDQLQVTLFQIIKRVKQRELQRTFIYSSIYLSIINYWKITRINSSLKYSITIINQFTRKIQINNQKISQSIKFKLETNKNLYFSIFTQKLRTYDIKSALTEAKAEQLNSKLKTLQKEIAFRKLYSYQKQMVSQQKSSKSERSMSQAQICQHEEGNPQKVSLCFQDGIIQCYDIGDISLIKQKLQNILLQKERKEQRQNQQAAKKKMTDQEACLKINMKQLKPERISFGIGLIPPKRNLQAFYSD